MKKFFSIVAMAFGISATAIAQECVMPISIVLDEDFSGVPTAANTILEQTLTRIAMQNNLSTDWPDNQFVMTVHCDVLDKSNLPGPPIQTVYNFGLTFYIADMFNKTKFATEYVEVNGVGTGEVKSYINAFRKINGNQQAIKNLITTGKKKMMAYFDSQAPMIFKEAERLLMLQKYEEAIFILMSIPLCSRHGAEAEEKLMTLYKLYIDRLNLYLLNEARAIWAAGQTQNEAYAVCSLLAKIDPDAQCYGEAQKLMAEVKGQVRKDIDFEMREKYHDEITLRKLNIDAIKAIGVAYGNHQQPTTTNLMWMR